MFFYNNSIKESIEFAEREGYELLTHEEEVDLINSAQKGDKEAERKIIYSNLKLVASYVSKHQCKSFTKEDIFHEGIFGLYDAIYKFDTTKGYRFSTYASWYIRQRIIRSINNKDRIIRRPVYVEENIRKISKVDKLISIGEKIDEDTLADISKQTGLTDKEVKRAIENSFRTLSINKKVKNKDGDSIDIVDYIDYNSIDNEPSMEEKVNDKILRETIFNKVKKILNEKEYFVVMNKVGNNEEGKVLTFIEIAKKTDSTKANVTNIYHKAIKKLKNSGEFKEFVNV